MTEQVAKQRYRGNHNQAQAVVRSYTSFASAFQEWNALHPDRTNDQIEVRCRGESLAN